MPKRKCKFNEKLEKLYPFLKRDKDDSHLRCLKCGGRFSMGSSGRGDIVSHLTSKKHKRSMNIEKPHCPVIEPRNITFKNEKICRICTSSAISSSSTNLFEDGHNLLTKIQNITGCSLTDEGGLPKYICMDCEENLESAHSFRETCLNSQLLFSSNSWKDGRPQNILEKDTDRATRDELAKLQEIEKVLVDIKEEDNLTKSSESDALEISNDCQRIEPVDDLILRTDFDKYSEIIPEVLITTENTDVTKVCRDRHESSNASAGKEKADLICDRCGNHFTSLQHFRTHQRRHTNNKEFKCEVCPKQCYTSTELKHHMRRHTGERPFACQYCQRRFTDYSTRVRHERTHTNERPYACSQCGKAFTRANLLRKHLLVHTGERPFKCIECNKNFQTRTSRTVHYRSIMHQQAVEKLKNNNQDNGLGT